MELPLRAQGTLLTGVRGCDLTPKLPLDSAERQLVSFLRWCVMNPADPREVDIPGAFFQSTPPAGWKASQFGHYPQHWYSHLMHCFEVIGYDHHDPQVRTTAFSIYLKLVDNLHLNMESRLQYDKRISEDRIAAGTVVS